MTGERPFRYPRPPERPPSEGGRGRGFGRPWSLPYLGLLSLMVQSPGAAGAGEHWAFLLLRRADPPLVADPEWRGSPVDAFVRERLARLGIEPTAALEPREWLRRVTYDLTGLPPTREEVAAFLALPEPDYAGAADRLLASPHFGEHWGRMWLDAVRYADSNGQDENMAMAHAWRYRDWVVGAFNRDLPYREFLRHQLAGDLLTGGSEEDALERVVATGFLVVGPKILAEQDKEKMSMDILDEQIDTFGRSMLGITLGCARCHDHKYDPVSTREYYALAGVFHSTRTMANRDHVSMWNERPVATASDHEAAAAHAGQVEANGKAIVELAARADGELRGRLLDDAERALAGAEHPQWTGILGGQPADSPLRTLRGPALRAFLRELEGIGNNSRFSAGKIGFALRGASRSIVDVPHRPELEAEQFTVEAMVRLEREVDPSSDHRRWLVNKNQNEWERGHIALILSGSRAGAYLAPEGGREKQIIVLSEETAVPVGEWVHLAMTFSGSELAVWANGGKLASAAVDRTRQTNTFPLRIGGRADGHNFFEEGLLDSVRVYNRVLAEAELQRRASNPDTEITDGLVLREDFEPRDETERSDALRAVLADQLYGNDGPLARAEAGWSAENQAEMQRLRDEQERLRVPFELPVALAVSDAEIRPLPVFARGNHLDPTGEPVPRGVPVALSPGRPAPAIGGQGSGRLELADWLVDEHPLTARVWVNRIWQTLFGKGLVSTPDNFGPSGEAPTHPELLDWLASELQRREWSTKALVREIVLSRTYRLSGTPRRMDDLARDPDGRFLGRMPARRLTAEMIRDTLFAVSGQLDRSVGGTVETFKNGDYVRGEEESYRSARRALYLPVIRDRVNPMLTTFDFSNASASCSQRQESVVPLQALFFLNAPVVIELSQQWANRLLREVPDPVARLARAYLDGYGREPSPEEHARARRFFSEHPQADEVLQWTDFCQTLLAANEMIYLP